MSAGRRACLLAAVGALFATLPAAAQTFEDEQRAHARVETAFQHQQAGLEALFAEQGIPYPPREIYLRVFKRERVLELWARGDLESAFQLLRSVPVCAVSGTFGPKRREGDRQHPEGFYTLDRFNHLSRYLLSLRVGYPNDSDDILSDPEHPGGDIYIHGGCGSTGCLAVTDDGAEWLYVLAVLARSAGQLEIPLHTFPVRFDETNLAWLRGETSDPVLWQFWDDLRPAWDYFEEHRRVPRVEVGPDGRYQIVSP